jgi:hypothetical protein
MLSFDQTRLSMVETNPPTAPPQTLYTIRCLNKSKFSLEINHFSILYPYDSSIASQVGPHQIGFERGIALGSHTSWTFTSTSPFEIRLPAAISSVTRSMVSSSKIHPLNPRGAWTTLPVNGFESEDMGLDDKRCSTELNRRVTLGNDDQYWLPTMTSWEQSIPVRPRSGRDPSSLQDQPLGRLHFKGDPAPFSRKRGSKRHQLSD